MKYFIMLVALIVLTGCGEYGDDLDRQLLNSYKQDCINRGYIHIHIKVTYMFGRPSAYYKCL